jgi:hypothetical protein
MNTKQFKQALRNGPYCWPGGYPCFFIMSDGEALSFAAAKDNAKTIIRAIRDKSRCGWRVEGFTVNWEDTDLICAHTGQPIESAYGE